MQNAGCEPPVLAAHAVTDEPHRDIRILTPPAAVGAVKSVDSQQILASDREIRPPRAPPISAVKLAQRPQRQCDERQQTVDVAASPCLEPRGRRPKFRPQLF